MKTLKELRGERSVQEIALAVGISRQALHQIEAGNVETPHPLIIQSLAKFYKKSEATIRKAIDASP